MAQNDKTKGVWIIKTPEGDIIPENSEIAALRTAVSTGGKLEFVQYGDVLGNPSPIVRDEAPVPKVTKPKAEPKTETATDPVAAGPDNF